MGLLSVSAHTLDVLSLPTAPEMHGQHLDRVTHQRAISPIVATEEDGIIRRQVSEADMHVMSCHVVHLPVCSRGAHILFYYLMSMLHAVGQPVQGVSDARLGSHIQLQNHILQR